jgi:hypothetical protein
MRTLATLAVIATTFAIAHEANAQSRENYPWCARYDGYTYNCGFVTWQQCQANISGIGGICYQNPMAGPVVESPASRKRKHKRTY